MRLRRRRPAKDVAASIEDAARAREDATGRLEEARDLIAVQRERARYEQATIIAALKRMRENNNLARMIMDTVERDTNDAGGGSGRTD